MLVHYGFTTKEGFMVEIHRYKLLKGCTQSRSLFCIYVRQLGSHYCTSFNSKPKFSWLLSTYTLTPLYAELALAFSPKKKMVLVKLHSKIYLCFIIIIIVPHISNVTNIMWEHQVLNKIRGFWYSLWWVSKKSYVQLHNKMC